MRNFKIISVCFLFAWISRSYGYGHGVSTQPLGLQNKIVSTEMTGVANNGSGVGLQARYLQRISETINVEGGIGIASGERENRLFLAADFELLPDYGKQPKIVLRPSLERAEEFEQSRNIFKISPVVSKGFSLWGKEAYPFLALPSGVSLNSDTKEYQSEFSVAMGITGAIPIKGMNKFIGNIEANINLHNSYNGVFMGISYPLQ